MFSFSIFEVVLFEVTNVMAVSSRQLIWRADLIAMTYLIVLILPIALFYSIAREYGLRQKRAMACTAFLQSGYLYFFWRLGALLDKPHATQSSDLTTAPGNAAQSTSLQFPHVY